MERGELPLKAWKDCLRCPKFQACDEIAVLRVLRPQRWEQRPPLPPVLGVEDGTSSSSHRAPLTMVPGRQISDLPSWAASRCGAGCLPAADWQSASPRWRQSTAAGEVTSEPAFATRALRARNYKLFFTGQGISLIGTWMTRIAMSWLAYRLTGSAASSAS